MLSPYDDSFVIFSLWLVESTALFTQIFVHELDVSFTWCLCVFKGLIMYFMVEGSLPLDSL